VSDPVVDAAWMARAVRLAERGRYTTDPNPCVGCVLVRDGSCVGEGWHRRAGESHAERLALAAAGEAARGATAYVTLEPCCHHGRTPPCTDGLLEAGVSRVVVGMRDPNPLVAGEGIARLRAAGVPVEVGVLEADAQRLNPGFVRRMETGRPFVRIKLAMSLDGRTAMASGESKWITGEAARLDVQRLRAASSAIVTGVETVLADDPSMNVRLSAAELPGMPSAEPVRQPLRVILDSGLRTPREARLLALPGRTLVVGIEGPANALRALEQAGAEVVILPSRDGRIALAALLGELGRREVNSVLIEAGPTLAGAFLRERLVDEIVIYVAPHVMGDAARGLFRLPGLQDMAERVSLSFTDVRHVGPDLRITAVIS
jgi:diaminohydroxyphosphoribosylaminopyrimidine deaminase/5-amino-6-(5-phosphoribosylamino)uracil reductase